VNQYFATATAGEVIRHRVVPQVHGTTSPQRDAQHPVGVRPYTLVCTVGIMGCNIIMPPKVNDFS